jgi:photosystem II stability/assembly factor-like uncharacterized protein
MKAHLLSNGYAAWSATQYAVTDNGGKTWTEGKLKDPKQASGEYSQIQFVDAKSGWILPKFGTIHVTQFLKITCIVQ